MPTRKSFLEKMNDANFGKRGMYIAGATIIAILLVKVLVIPFLEPLNERPFFRSLRFWNTIVENIAIANIVLFFVAIFFFREKIGGKILYAMQLKDKTYFKEKWILVWLKTIWICLGVIAVTTVISQAFFKGWGSFIFLTILIAIPLYAMNKMKKFRNQFFK